MSKSWLKIIQDLKFKVTCLHTRYGKNISNHIQYIWLDFTILIRKIFFRGIPWKQKKKKKRNYKVGTWYDCKHHNAVKFLVCFFPNSTITLSKFYIRRTSDKVLILQSCFLNVSPYHINIMVKKSLNLFNNLLPNVCICLLRKKSTPILLEGIVQFTHPVP